MAKKKYKTGVNLADPLAGVGQFAGMYSAAFNDEKAAKYGQIATDTASVLGGLGKTDSSSIKTPQGKIQKNTQTADDIFAKEGMNIGEMLARKGMRVTKKKKGKKKGKC